MIWRGDLRPAVLTMGGILPAVLVLLVSIGGMSDPALTFRILLNPALVMVLGGLVGVGWAWLRSTLYGAAE